MIELLVGSPGAGKSMYAMRLVCEELRGGRRIVTNLSVKMAGLCWFLKEKYSFDLDISRVVLLSDDQVKRFWQYVQDGDFVAIDECQVYWNSRNWQDTGKELIDFFSQHRKRGIDIILITQNVQLIDKQLRLLVSKTTILKNLKYFRFSFFKLPKRIVGNEFFGVPMPSDSALRIWTMSIDKDLGETYDSGAGVGGIRGVGDVNKEAKGIPVVFGIVGFFAILFAVAYLPRAGVRAAIERSKVTPGTVVVTNDSSRVVTNNSSSNVNVISQSFDSETNRIVGFYQLPWSDTGWLVFSDGSRRAVRQAVQSGDRWLYLLSDGKTIVRW
jgi:hypothetical protein